MRVSQVAPELLVDIYNYTLEHQPVTIKDVRLHFVLSRQHTHKALTVLRKNGYVTYTGKQGATPAKFFTTDKPFDIKKPEPKIQQQPPIKCKPVKHLKTFDIEIKPDLAAMWLVKSKPHWEKRSIPIVRSIGLGAKLNMY